MSATLLPVDNPSNSAMLVGQGPRCERCQAPLQQGRLAICPCCGWYASVGVFVEVDPAEAAQARTGEVPVPQPASMWQVWSGLVPNWGWAIIATQVAIIAGSIAVRVCVPADGVLYAWWGSVQFIAALGLLVVCHFAAFVIASANDVDMGVADLVVKPLRAWARHAAELPHRLTLINTGASSVTAALCAALVIGGIPWYVLLDWKFKQPPKQNLMAAVISQAQTMQGDEEGLEEAVEDFAGGADGAADAAKGKDKKEKPAAEPRAKADCVIYGYDATADGHITALLLASEHQGKLISIGQVSPKLDADAEIDLLANLKRSSTTRAFVSTTRAANWVVPRVTCRVSYAKKTESGRLTKIEWDSLLGELRLPWN